MPVFHQWRVPRMAALPVVIAARSAGRLVIATLWAIADRLPAPTFPIIAWVAAVMLPET